MSFQAVIFDLDGTLLDTLTDLAQSMNTALERLGLPVHSLDDYKQFVGDGMETLVRRVLPADRQDPAFLTECTQLMSAEYAQHWSDQSQPYPGIAKLLDGLAAGEIPIAVLSNKPEEFTCLCVEKLLPRWEFDVVMGAKPSLPRKPDPTGALEIARQLELPPAEILYLGDTDTDMRTAVGAGMFPVGALWGFRTADELLAHGAQVLAERPIDLLQLLT